MCVDDYEFRHYSAIKPKECRRFNFINQDEIQKAFLVNISQFQENGEVALCKILFYLSSKGLPITSRMFYWPKFNISIQPGDYCKVPFAALNDKQITFHSMMKTNNQEVQNSRSGFNEAPEIVQQVPQKRQQTDDGQLSFRKCDQCMLDECQSIKCFQKEQSSNDQNIQQQRKSSQSTKEDELLIKRVKEPQRQIGEVILAVKKWRKLYESKKLNLTKAARIIGISKKSLDDYFLVLRVGQILGFDYSQNLNKKMGDLRAHIRTFNYKVTGKLSKQVKCFELVPDFQIDSLMDQQLQAQIPSCTDLDQI